MQSPMTSGDPRIEFWSKPELWPDDDAPHYIFLARAVGIVGRTIYGPEWTGREPFVELVAPLPEELNASIPQVDLFRGCNVLLDHEPEYAARCPKYVFILKTWPIPSQAEWGRAAELVKTMSEQRNREHMRFFEVCARFANAFKSGAIGTATRDVAGGPLEAQDRWLWNTEIFWWRFHTCRIDMARPFYSGPAVTGGEFIFVDIPSLQAALQTVPAPVNAPPQQEQEEHYLSPYLQCMIAATKALKISACDTRKKQDIIAELPKFWPGAPGDLSAEDLDRMATLLREPANKGGRRFKKRPSDRPEALSATDRKAYSD